MAETSYRKRNAAVFTAVVLAWLAFDQATKVYFNEFTLGDKIAGPFLGLFQFRLAHNTGGAWGVFSDSTTALAVVSVLVCIALALYLFVLTPGASLLQTFGLSLVVSGGIGNAIDRFAQGYVVDFIDLTFMDFPVFNIADIGVTCGFALFFIAILWEWRVEDQRLKAIGLATESEATESEAAENEVAESEAAEIASAETLVKNDNDNDNDNREQQ